MKAAHRAAALFVPVLVVVVWHIVFIVWGCDSLLTNKELHTTPFLIAPPGADKYPIKDKALAECASTIHLWKYSFLNVFVAVFAVLTFFFFHAGGEGARARAMLLTILHLALSVWGILMWSHSSPTCRNMIAKNYREMYDFGQIAVLHNAVLFILFLMHEYFADELGVDLTVVAIFSKDVSPNYDYYESIPDPMMKFASAPMPDGDGNGINASDSSSEPAASATNSILSPKSPSRAIHESPSRAIHESPSRAIHESPSGYQEEGSANQTYT